MFLASLIAFLPFLHNAQEVADHFPSSESAIEALTETSVSQFQRDLDQFLSIPAKERNFENTLRFWDRLNGELNQTSNWMDTIKEVHPEKKIRDSAEQALQNLNQALLHALANHPEIYTHCASIEKSALSEQQGYLLDQLLGRFRVSGMQLEREKRDLFAQLQEEIFHLKSLFDRQIAEDFPVLFASKEELAGLEESWLVARKQNEEDIYRLACDLPTYLDVLSYCSVRKTRKAMCELFSSRAYPQNEEVAVQLIEKQNQLGQLAGFPSYAAYKLSSQMVGSPEKAKAFLKSLKEKADLAAQREFALVTAELPTGVFLTSSGQLEPFDGLYVLDQYKKKHFSTDQSLIAEYFPLDQTIQGLIGIYEQFFNLSIREAHHSLPIPDLKALEIREPSGQLLGIVLLDLFPREGKCAHSGVCYPLLDAYSPSEGIDYPALCFVLGNFTKPTQDRPSLMKHGEVMVFFHEFGHAIHSILGRNAFFSFCGTSVKRDFVEVPSILLENWIWDPAILKQISSHYLSGKALPEESIQSIIRTRDFGFGMWLQKQCFFSELSLAFFDGREVKNPTALMQQVWEEERPHTAPGENNHFHASWWHFSNYGPNYYSYLWASVFASDLFDTIRQGGLRNPEMGEKYAQTILKKGGSRDPEHMLVDFLGREPSLDSFFKRLDGAWE